MKRFKLVVEDFMSEEQCKIHINYAETSGFDEATIQTRGEGQVMNKGVRDNDRHILDDTVLAKQLFEQVKEHLPEELPMVGPTGDKQMWRPIGLNERFRYYRYKDGQQFKVHPDGHFKRNEEEISMITMIIYLNEDFEGGATEFVMPHQIIVPKTGMLLLFRHNQLHKGNPVPKGTKYVLRTDVMYKKD